MRFYRQPEQFRQLSSLYWKLRSLRVWDSAGRRKLYRYIRVERDRLVDSGMDAEHVRLFCRHMASSEPDSPCLRRLMAYEDMLSVWSKLAIKFASWRESSHSRMCDSSGVASEENRTR
uniref:Uncharacterized protein n=1 Tax=uncultured prokaryote TaxID=198431 RepID=A0A0H5QHX7_9ZZZZ|nr:hypothetical protein [uncultured prokaryote]